MDKNIYFVHILSIYLSYAAFFVATFAAVLYLIQDNNIKNKQPRAVSSCLPNLSFLDRLNYRSVGLGFPMLTLAIVSGFLLAKDIFGSYWNWNPRQIYSIVLWLLYGIILHVRLSVKLRGKKVALLSVLAFFVIIFTLLSTCREV